MGAKLARYENVSAALQNQVHHAPTKAVCNQHQQQRHSKRVSEPTLSANGPEDIALLETPQDSKLREARVVAKRTTDKKPAGGKQGEDTQPGLDDASRW